MSHTQKVFVLTFITKYLPIFLTAFVYIPFGDKIVGQVRTYFHNISGWEKTIAQDIHVDTSRLRSEIIALTVTEQISSFGEELLLPLFKLKARKWYATYKGTNKFNYSRTEGACESPAEARLLAQIRDESMRDAYNVQEDIQEMVTQ